MRRWGASANPSRNDATSINQPSNDFTFTSAAGDAPGLQAPEFGFDNSSWPQLSASSATPMGAAGPDSLWQKRQSTRSVSGSESGQPKAEVRPGTLSAFSAEDMGANLQDIIQSATEFSNPLDFAKAVANTRQRASQELDTSGRRPALSLGGPKPEGSVGFFGFSAKGTGNESAVTTTKSCLVATPPPDNGRTADSPLEGTCTDMCPADERELRQRTQGIRMLERVDPRDSGRTSAHLAVKSFARTGIDEAGPAAFRTMATLERTMTHLRRLMDDSNAQFSSIHTFLFDRYRSVRQDLYVQGKQDEFACGVYEEIIRYHLLCEHELCESEASVSDPEGYSSHLNIEQLNKSLISLLDMYMTAERRGNPRGSHVEAEFWAYHLIMLLAQHGKFSESRLLFYTALQAMRPEVQAASAVQMVLRLRTAFAAGNWVAFFTAVRGAPYLLACAAHAYFRLVRSEAIATMAAAYSAGTGQEFPLASLTHSLMLNDEEEARQLCQLYSIPVISRPGGAVIHFNKGLQMPLELPPKRKSAAICARMQQPPSANVVRTTQELTEFDNIQANLSPQQQLCQQQQQVQQQQEGRDLQQRLQRLQQRELQQQRQLQQQQQQLKEAKYQQKQQQKQQLERQQQYQQEARDREAIQLAALERLRWQVEELHRKDAMRQQQIGEARRMHLQAEAAASHKQQLRKAIVQEQDARAARATEVVRLRKVLWLRLIARMWALAARTSATQRAALRLAVVRLGAHSVWRERYGATDPRHHQRQQQQGRILSLQPEACPTLTAEYSLGLGFPYQSALLDDARSSPTLHGQQQWKLPRSQPRGATTVYVAADVAGYMAERNPGAVQLSWKAILVVEPHSGSGSGGDVLRGAAQWLRCRLSGPLPQQRDDLPGQLLMAAALCHRSSNRDKAAHQVVRLCVRDLSSMDTSASDTLQQQASGGSSGMIILTDALPLGSLSSAVAAQVAAALPAVPVPLLVLSLCHNDDHIRVAAAVQSAHPCTPGRVSAVRVLNLPWSATPSATDAAEVVLQGGLAWLASQSPRQPCLQAEKIEVLSRRIFVNALSAVPAGMALTLEQLLMVYNDGLNTTSSAIREASQLAAAQWQWPPQEVAAPFCLPLLTGTAKGEALMFCQPSAGRTAGILGSTPPPATEPWSLPGLWHAPHTMAALEAALQSVAAPTPLNAATSPADYFASLALSSPVSRGDVDAAYANPSAITYGSGGWLQKGQAALIARLSDMSLLELPAVVLPDHCVQLPGMLVDSCYCAALQQLTWQEEDTPQAPLLLSGAPHTGSKRKADRMPDAAPPTARVPNGFSTGPAKLQPAPINVASLELQLAKERVISAKSHARLLQLIAGGDSMVISSVQNSTSRRRHLLQRQLPLLMQ